MLALREQRAELGYDDESDLGLSMLQSSTDTPADTSVEIMDWREAADPINDVPIIDYQRQPSEKSEIKVIFKETCDDADIVKNPKYATLDLSDDDNEAEGAPKP